MKTIENISIEQLFREHYRKLCLYATNIVKEENVAEDIVMDQFLKLSERIKKTPGKILNPQSYLYRMTRSACIDYVRKTVNVVLPEDVTELPDDNNEMEERLERELRLWGQIDTLPPACRKILLMSKCNDMKYKEIADALGISVKTVESQMGKAYSILRGKFRAIYLMSIVFVAGIVVACVVAGFRVYHKGNVEPDVVPVMNDSVEQVQKKDTIAVLHFDNAPLNDVMRQLSRHYGVEMTVSDTTKRVSGDIEVDSLANTVDILQQILDIKIKVK